jgi:hypothetical protein
LLDLELAQGVPHSFVGAKVGTCQFGVRGIGPSAAPSIAWRAEAVVAGASGDKDHPPPMDADSSTRGMSSTRSCKSGSGTSTPVTTFKHPHYRRPSIPLLFGTMYPLCARCNRWRTARRAKERSASRTEKEESAVRTEEVAAAR